MYFDLFRCLCWFQGPKFGQQKAKNSRFGPLNSKKPILVHWYCVEAFLMTLLRSYMMETDLPMCVLICLDVYLGLKKQKFVTNKQKIADFVSQRNIKATKSVLENKIRSMWPILSSGVQDKDLNRSKHTLADQIPSYMTFESHWNFSVSTILSHQDWIFGI